MADDERHTRPSPTEKMVELGGDPHRLLRGEDPGSEYADDARHWIAVYHELLDFKQDILRTIRKDMEQMSESARHELVDTDLPVMEAEARRFEHRISFWEGRLEELEGARRSSGHG